MKIKFDHVFTDLDGTEIPSTTGALTLRSVTASALLDLPGSKALPADESVRRYSLATKIYDGGTDISAEDIVLIKNVISVKYGPIIVGPAFEILDHPIL